MNIINNKSNLAPLFGNVINSLSENSNSENKNLLSYKKIFNKSILWVKIYDNYLYLFLNKNKNNKFSILEPKTKVNTEVNNTLATASSPALANTMLVPMAEVKNNKVKINRNTIKLINRNIKNNNNQEVKKEIKININKYIKSISKYNSETVKYQNIVYQFNKNNKGIQNIDILLYLY
jgi:hypothetical protein